MTWKDEARRASARIAAPVFPIRIFWDEARQKWQKVPLTNNGLKDASLDVEQFNWNRANGFGIRTGSGLYVLDVDDASEGSAATEWIRHWVPDYAKTLIHRTVSGGYHLLFKVSGEWLDLATRNGVATGLDARGAGGFIAFGNGYSVFRGTEPLPLPIAAAKELAANHYAGGKAQAVDPVDYQIPNEAEAHRRVRRAVWHGSRSLKARWSGHPIRHRTGRKQGQVDKSAMDHSVARLLAMDGVPYDVIVWALLNRFEHGAARWHASHVGLRAAQRCAAKAIDAQEAVLTAYNVNELGAGDEVEFFAQSLTDP